MSETIAAALQGTYLLSKLLSITETKSPESKGSEARLDPETLTLFDSKVGLLLTRLGVCEVAVVCLFELETNLCSF